MPSEVATLAHALYTATKQALSSGDATAARGLYDQFIARFGSLRGAFANGTLTPSREGALLLALENAQGRPSALLLGFIGHPQLRSNRLTERCARDLQRQTRHGEYSLHR